MTLVMAIACGVAAANIYYNQPMLGIMEAAFRAHARVIGLVPTATQLGFAAGLLLLVPLGDRFDRRRLILIQLAALTLSLAAAALAPDAWSLVVTSALVGGAASVAQQIVPFAAELAELSRRGATIGIVMSSLLCGILFGRVLAGAVGDHYGWRAMFWLGMLLAVALGLLLAAVLPRSWPKTQEGCGALLKSLGILSAQASRLWRLLRYSVQPGYTVWPPPIFLLDPNRLHTCVLAHAVKHILTIAFWPRPIQQHIHVRVVDHVT
jgi:predicted MFS family arabinose efflux permease